MADASPSEKVVSIQKAAAARAYAPYRAALAGLNARGVPYLVGGTFAFAAYTGISRPTKDLDLFETRDGRDRALEALRELGWQTQIAFAHWLAKAQKGEHSLDVIHGAGNGVAIVDDEWFAHARPARVFGVETSLVPAEEMVWSKAFVMEKYRYDGADVAHLLLRQGASLDWKRLLRRFGRHWRVLLSHLVLFEFIYPGQRVVPPSLISALVARVARENGELQPSVVCRGVLLSRKQYRIDTETWGLRDARLDSDVAMSPEDIVEWTLADPARPGPDA